MANILIVEDEKNMQNIIAEYMQRGGHTCFTADDGVDALMILKNNPMDLMILDVMMPHLDGFSVCKMAREMSNLPILKYISQSRTLTWMLPPAEVYFTALSRMLNNASEVQRLS